MPPEKNSAVDFLNNIDASPEVFKEEEQVIDKPTNEEEEKLPFHKDPKVQNYVEKQIQKALKDIKPSAEQQFRQEVKEEINLPASFIRLVGNDTDEKKEVLRDLSKYFGTLKGEARQEFLAEMQEKERQQQEQDQAAVDELNAGFETIEEEYGVNLNADVKTRTAFVEFLRKVSHKNAEGEVDQFADIPSTWETFQEKQTAPPRQASRAKELASRGMARSTDASTAIPAGRSWKDVDRYFDKLKANN